MEKSNTRLFIIALAIFAAITGLLFGYDTGVVAGALLFVKKDFHITIYQQQLIVSIMLLAAGIATLFSGYLTDKFGRKVTILIGAFLFIIGASFLTFAYDYSALIFGRIITGFAIGISMTAAPMYIAEIAPPRARGGLVTINQLFVTLGILLAFILNYAFSSWPQGWRWMFGIGVIPALVQFIALMYFPKTPRFLASKGRNKEALKILRTLRPNSQAERELDKIKASLKKEKTKFKDLLHSDIWPPFTVSIALHSFQQLTGINAVIYYAPQIFLSTGITSTGAAILATIGVGIVNVLMTIIAIPLLDKWGRRPLFLTGLVGMIITLIAISISFLLGVKSSIIAIIAMIALMGFVGSFAVSLGPMPWLMPNEMLPTKVKGRAASLAIFTNWFFNFVVSGTFLTMVRFLGSSVTFGIYAAIGILAWIFFYACLPETKNKLLEDIKVGFLTGKKK